MAKKEQTQKSNAPETVSAKVDFGTEQEKAADAKKAAEDTGFKPKDSERKFYHVDISKQTFDPKTGKKVSRENVQIFSVPEWNQFKQHAANLGHEINILWDPTKN